MPSANVCWRRCCSIQRRAMRFASATSSGVITPISATRYYAAAAFGQRAPFVERRFEIAAAVGEIYLIEILRTCRRREKRYQNDQSRKQACHRANLSQ